jgi:hypothetical protein
MKNFTEEYPLGNSLEPFDIVREKNMMDDFEEEIVFYKIHILTHKP